MRLNWSSTRHGPDEFDNSAPEQPDFSFDYTRNSTPGSQSWPDKFGPTNIRKAWKAGLVVVAEIEGFPYPVAVSEARWTKTNKTLTVKTLEGWKIADRLWTRPDTKHLTSSGLLIESDD
jgi:hypothetical protein